MTDISAEIHAEISEVLEHDAVILCGETADDLEFGIGEIGPSGVVGVIIENTGDITFREYRLEFGFESLTAIAIDIELHRWDIEGPSLGEMGGESGVKV